MKAHLILSKPPVSSMCTSQFSNATCTIRTHDSACSDLEIETSQCRPKSFQVNNWDQELLSLPSYKHVDLHKNYPTYRSLRHQFWWWYKWKFPFGPTNPSCIDTFVQKFLTRSVQRKVKQKRFGDLFLESDGEKSLSPRNPSKEVQVFSSVVPIPAHSRVSDIILPMDRRSHFLALMRDQIITLTSDIKGVDKKSPIRNSSYFNNFDILRN